MTTRLLAASSYACGVKCIKLKLEPKLGGKRTNFQCA